MHLLLAVQATCQVAETSATRFACRAKLISK